MYMLWSFIRRVRHKTICWQKRVHLQKQSRWRKCEKKRRSCLNTIYATSLIVYWRRATLEKNKKRLTRSSKGRVVELMTRWLSSVFFKKQSVYKLTPNKILLNRTHIAWRIPRSKKMTVTRKGKTKVAKLLRRWLGSWLLADASLGKFGKEHSQTYMFEGYSKQRRRAWCWTGRGKCWGG